MLQTVLMTKFMLKHSKDVVYVETKMIHERFFFLFFSFTEQFTFFSAANNEIPG